MSPVKKPPPASPQLGEPGRNCTECKRPSCVLVTLEPGPGPRGQEPCHLCPKCWSE